jgi:uncharacterized protein (DUF1697 family)
MNRYIALLRSINVGKRQIKMDVLKELFRMADFDNIVTYIQSGNVLFDTKQTNELVLRKAIEEQLEKGTGFEVKTIIRNLEEIAKVIKASPFDPEAETNRKLYITFLAEEPHAEKAAGLEALSTDSETMKIINREVYFLTPAYGETKFSNNFMEKKLGIVATTRNWQTVNKVLEL